MGPIEKIGIRPPSPNWLQPGSDASEGQPAIQAPQEPQSPFGQDLAELSAPLPERSDVDHILNQAIEGLKVSDGQTNTISPSDGMVEFDGTRIDSGSPTGTHNVLTSGAVAMAANLVALASEPQYSATDKDPQYATAA